MIAWRSLFTESARAFGVGVTVRLCLGLSVGTARAARCQISAVEAKPHPKVDNARRPSWIGKEPPLIERPEWIYRREV